MSADCAIYGNADFHGLLDCFVANGLATEGSTPPPRNDDSSNVIASVAKQSSEIRVWLSHQFFDLINASLANKKQSADCAGKRLIFTDYTSLDPC
ncbi:MAG: hypothetical protein LBT00_16030 [Spirochaetaceae bacterium]|nr:hypothetical protein [Spirochaetaceae bacterium]